MEIESLRSKIDALDRAIVRLINRRAAVAQEIGKRKAPLRAPVYDPEREREVYESVVSRNEGPLSNETIKAVYREIMSGTVALQRPVRVAYFGPPGTFTHQAARKKFGSSVEYLPERDIPEVFSAVVNGKASCGVVPVENSTEGPVNVTIDTLAETPLKIISEICLPIRLALLGHGPVSSVRRLYSHRQPLAQCRRYIGTRLPGAEIREASSTVAAVEQAAIERGAAAIAAELAVEGRDVKVLERRIEDSADNVTRFFVVAENPPPPTGADKTTVLVSIKDEVGALHAMLEVFLREGINLTWIQSRPSRRRAWDYVFFVDLEGHAEDERVRRALEALESRTRHVQVLGSYPAAERTPDV